MSINNIHMEVIVGVTAHGAFDTWREGTFGDAPITDCYQYLIRCAEILNDQLGGQTSQLYEIGEHYVASIMGSRSVMTEGQLRAHAEMCIEDHGEESLETQVANALSFETFEIQRVGVTTVEETTPLDEVGVTTTQVVSIITPEADTSLYDRTAWALYGRLSDGTTQHISDTSTKGQAVELYYRLTDNQIFWTPNNVAITGLPQRINRSTDNDLVICQTLHDNGDFPTGAARTRLNTNIHVTPTHIEICAQGFSNATMDEGGIIIIEFYEGELRLVAWSNINQEDPTHIVSFHNARVSALREE